MKNPSFTRRASAALAALLPVLLAGCSMQMSFLTPQPITSTPISAPAQNTAAQDATTPPAVYSQHVTQVIAQAPIQPTLTTEVFESGEMRLPEVSNNALETFLVDLNQRKDYDAACHDGNPGPNAAFLTTWINKSIIELKSRGYYYDASGTLHRPGAPIAVR